MSDKNSWVEQAERERAAIRDHRRCERPGCSEEFVLKPYGKHRKYCSKNCKESEVRRRRREREGKTFVAQGPGRKLLAFRCRKGHERTRENTRYDRNSRRCSICARERAREQHQRDREKINAKNRAWREKNREYLREAARYYYQTHREEILARKRARAAA